MNREPPSDPCWQVGLHSLAWPLLFKTTLASGVPSKHSPSAGCWCTDRPWWACNQHSPWRALRSHWSRRQIQVQTTNRQANYSSWLSRNQTSLLGLRSLLALLHRNSRENTGFWIRLDLGFKSSYRGQICFANPQFPVYKVEMVPCNSWRVLWSQQDTRYKCVAQLLTHGTHSLHSSRSAPVVLLSHSVLMPAATLENHLGNL